jgi:hypothetical protein
LKELGVLVASKNWSEDQLAGAYAVIQLDTLKVQATSSLDGWSAKV